MLKSASKGEALDIGALTGAVLVLRVGGLLRHSHCHCHCLRMDSRRQLVMPALVMLSFARAQAMGGSGFIAPFCAGLLTGYLYKRETGFCTRQLQARRDPLLVSGQSISSAVYLQAFLLFLFS
ncbi:hypothetical protein [Pseudomonas putida]|uniref:hypothetical protein n=1 Tax=Pseudomonas putida TaxID=303 RepID=UPI003905CFBD